MENVQLTQEEINALLSSYVESEDKVIKERDEGDNLSPEEMDALGEIGNISMGSASTTLSTLLNQKVLITSPNIKITNRLSLVESFNVPYISIYVKFTEGLTGFNLLVIKLADASIIADLMMGGDGTGGSVDEISEMEVSATSEAMNQMIGSSATSLSTMFNKHINISPPNTVIFHEGGTLEEIVEDPLVVVSFNMTIGSLIDTQIMQVMSLQTAREEARLLLNSYCQDMELTDDHQEIDIFSPLSTFEKDDTPLGSTAPPDKGQVEYNKEQYAQSDEKLNLVLDIPLKVSVMLGQTRKPVKEVLNFSPGAVVELSSYVDEPVDVMVNGILVARGEVVVVNENFGVRITKIISVAERMNNICEMNKQ